VRTVYTGIFTYGGSRSVPRHLKANLQKASKYFSSGFLVIIQSLALALYAFFVRIDALSKAMAGLFMAVFMYLCSPIVHLITLLKKTKKVLRKYRVIKFVKGCCCWIPLVVFKKGGCIRSKSEKVRVEQRNTIDLLGTGLVVFTWAVSSWAVFTLGGKIHDIYGIKEELKCINQWGLTLLFELFGVESLKQITLKICMAQLMGKLDACLRGDHSTIVSWYEANISKHLLVSYNIAGDGDEEYNVLLSGFDALYSRRTFDMDSDEEGDEGDEDGFGEMDFEMDA